ncbi:MULTISPECIES: helix-turn-helix domain-containing protein [Phaeobacter]|uniref:helix-turn-helix domain-containing protein n=1 Tax=Phaeobacter TaxID=302485 RepID=UPI003A8AFE3F
MSSTFSEIGGRLRELRARTGLNQQDFAETIDTSFRSYRAYENGKRELPTAAILRIHEIMNVSPHWLLLGEKEPTDDRSMQIIEQVAKASLDAMEQSPSERDNAEKAKMLRLLIKFSLAQGECLSATDIQELLG